MAQQEAPRGAPVPKNVKKIDKSGKKINLRLTVQIFFFALIALIAVNHALEERGMAINFLSSASLHAVCPFGGVVSIYQYVTAGTYVHKIHESAFILMYIVFALALLVGLAHSVRGLVHFNPDIFYMESDGVFGLAEWQKWSPR